ncbi:hypothetical protein HYR99_27500 [Candidatus Poribacteria bacterium]|nr:hypothetical protein [Candidatus Poribacteria bacterium]
MNKPRVFADFHNADAQGRLRLNCIGTAEDLVRQQIALQEGQSLVLYSEDLEVGGVVQHSEEENLWVAVIDWDAIREIPLIVSPTLHRRRDIAT